MSEQEKPIPSRERAEMLAKAIHFKTSFAKEILREVDQLKDELSQHLESGVCDKKFSTDGVQAIYCKRDSWEYSDTAKDQINKIRRYDKIDGTATRTSSYYWQVKAVKEGELNDEL